MILYTEGDIARMYGQIWGGDGQYIVADLKRYLKGKKNATIHIHSPGGSVFDGNLIYNELRKFKGELTFVIDGIAASMATVIISAADKIKMAENAWLMFHAPWGDMRGNAKELRQHLVVLEKTEQQLTKIYAKKMGKTIEEAESLMDGDNWMSSDMALDEGFIDEIVDPIIDDADIEAYTNFKIAACLENFEDDETLKSKYFAQPNPTQKSKSKNQNKSMKLNAKSLEVLGLKDEPSDEQVNAAIETINARNTELENRLKEINSERVDTLISGAVSSGKILAKDKDHYKQLAETDFELAQGTIERLPAKGSINDQLNKKSPSADGREDWTFAKWRKEDTPGLLAIKKDDPERYAEIIKK